LYDPGVASPDCNPLTVLVVVAEDDGRFAPHNGDMVSPGAEIVLSIVPGLFRHPKLLKSCAAPVLLKIDEELLQSTNDFLVPTRCSYRAVVAFVAPYVDPMSWNVVSDMRVIIQVPAAPVPDSPVPDKNT
jgi:hypothetical protein